MAALSDLRRAVRVPLFTRVEVRGATPVGDCYSANVSEGGLYLRASPSSPDDIPVGSVWWVSLRLGGQLLELRGEAVWVDRQVRDHQGRRAVAFGLRFLPGQDRGLEQVRRFLEGFRYRALVLGLEATASIHEALEGRYRVEPVASEEALRQQLSGGEVGLVLLGESGETDGGAGRLARLLAASEVVVQPPIVVCAQEATPELERRIHNSGRVVFLPMPFTPLALRSLAERLVESQALTAEIDALTRELRAAMKRLEDENRTLRLKAPAPRLDGLVGESAPMRRVYEMVERVAPLDTTVLVLGESGTGKDRLARAVHAKSPRAGKPYVAQNCAALSETLLDAELFGHVRGAFTGAVKDRAGLFETASGGTVFLDEVGEMSPGMQAKLLRVLQEREVRRVGSTKDISVDVRVVCATHRDLPALVKAGRFREDLYYRLRAFVLSLPPLRDRRSDIASLALHFIEQYAARHGRSSQGLTPEALALLEGHSWPGNVRELEHTIERLVVLSEDGANIEPALVREALRDSTASEPAGEAEGKSLDEQLEEFERARILAELQRAGGVVARAARALGMDRTTLSKRCKRLGLGNRFGQELEVEPPMPQIANLSRRP